MIISLTKQGRYDYHDTGQRGLSIIGRRYARPGDVSFNTKKYWKYMYLSFILAKQYYFNLFNIWVHWVPNHELTMWQCLFEILGLQGFAPGWFHSHLHRWHHQQRQPWAHARATQVTKSSRFNTINRFEIKSYFEQAYSALSHWMFMQ